MLFIVYQVLWNVFLHNMMYAVFHQCRRVFQLLNTMHTIQCCVHTIQLLQWYLKSLFVQKCIDRSGVYSLVLNLCLICGLGYGDCDGVLMIAPP